ncbi:MAG TPA: hypothetical protein VFV50_08655 [Bdellovibrionales bacterium]|nr:hypothetical protein [Bdellovibrionales bacterium]
MIILALSLGACGSAQKTEEPPAATPAPLAAPTPAPQPLAESKMSDSDHNYALYLEGHLAGLREGHPDKLLLEYVRYLHYGDPKFARAYIEGLLARAVESESPVGGMAIFEGPYVLCQMEGGRCVRTLGQLTREYLVPRLKNGDEAALELFVVHGRAADLDGVEDDAYQELASLPEIKRHARVLKRLERKHRDAFSKIL